MKSVYILAALCAAATLSISAKADNLVLNPTFSVSYPYNYPGYGPVTGWTGVSGSNPANGVFNNGVTLPTGDTTDGFIQVGLSTTPTIFSPTLTGSIAPGSVVDYSFYVDVRPDGCAGPCGSTTAFSLSINGNTVYSTSVLSPASAFTLVSGSFVDVAGGDTVDFSYTGNGQDTTVLLDNVNISAATPEPSSLVLLGTGILGLAGAARRRLTR